MYLPKMSQEKLAYFFMLFMVPYVAVFELIFILPWHYPDCTSNTTFWLHVTVGLFLAGSILANLNRFITLDSSIRGVFLSSAAQPDWRYCTVCETRCPPRSYHCTVCDVCILKRDHHCMFTGSCVGLTNQRHYLITILYFALAALYASYFNLPHTLATYSSSHSPPSLLFIHVFPLFALLLGVISLLECLVIFTTSLCLVGSALLLALLSFHLGLVLVNKTVYEWAHFIDDYGLGWRANLVHVFGSRGVLVCLVSPFFQSPLPSDGLTFPITTCSNGSREIRKMR